MPRNNAVGKLAIGGVMTALAVVALLLSLVPMIISVFRSRFGRTSTEAKSQ